MPGRCRCLGQVETGHVAPCNRVLQSKTHLQEIFNTFMIFGQQIHTEIHLFSFVLLLLLTESMSSMVSANSGMVCRVESTVLASTARNLLGETGSCGGGPWGISGPLQDLLSACSSMLLLLVVNVSSDTLSDQDEYCSRL